MKYSVKVTEINKSEGNLKGLASVVISDSFRLNNIAILNDPNRDKLFVSMPSHKTAEKNENGENVYSDVFYPVTKEFHDELYGNILDSYKELHEDNAVSWREETINASDKRMPEFSVRVTPYEKEGSNIKGLASIYLENSIKVDNVRILEGKDSKLFVAMPSYKTKQVDENGKTVYKDFCNPVTAEFREKLYGTLISTYEKEKEQGKGSMLGKLNENKDAVNNRTKQEPERKEPEHNHEDAR